MEDRYSRQTVFSGILEEGQEKLFDARVAVLGMGALGTVIANSLARAGVGFLRLVDRDFVELSNLHRQILYDESDVKSRLPKAVAAAKHLTCINSSVTIEPVVLDINPLTISGIIKDVDIVLDGTDNLETRLLINDACIKHNIPWIYGAAIGSFGITMNIIPGETACLRCIYKKIPAPGTIETCVTSGVLNMVTGIIGCLQSAEAVKFITGNGVLSKGIRSIGVWNNSFESFEVEKDEKCPACGLHKYDYLDISPSTHTTLLCGGSIQVIPANKGKIDFNALQERLNKAGNVECTPFLLRFTTNDIEMNIFEDGRAIIKGAANADAAKSIYAEYIGL